MTRRPRPARRLHRRSAADVSDAIAGHVDDAGVGWLLKALLAFVVVVLAVMAFGRDGEPVTTLDVGDPLPAFAAPLAARPRLDYDAVNLSLRGDSKLLGRVPACSIRSRSVVTSCDLLRAGPSVLVVFNTKTPGCERAIDALDRAWASTGPARMLGVAAGGEHDDTTRTARARGWTVPVAYDRDGELYRRLGAPTCAATFVVGRDGRVLQRLDGAPREDALRRVARALAAPAG